MLFKRWYVFFADETKKRLRKEIIPEEFTKDTSGFTGFTIIKDVPTGDHRKDHLN